MYKAFKWYIQYYLCTRTTWLIGNIWSYCINDIVTDIHKLWEPYDSWYLSSCPFSCARHSHRSLPCNSSVTGYWDYLKTKQVFSLTAFCNLILAILCFQISKQLVNPVQHRICNWQTAIMSVHPEYVPIWSQELYAL